MTKEELNKARMQRAQELFVISKHALGYRIYAPADPGKFYIVGGSSEAPTCSCPEFRTHKTEPRWRCNHILAVWSPSKDPIGTPKDPASESNEHHLKAPGENGATGNGALSALGPSQMLIKRSVSPDGRIDSLSVEFSSSVEKVTPQEIILRASKALMLQTEIVEKFLKRGAPDQKPADASVPAKMLTVGGMPGKWGRRLFINIEANGQTLKLFGNRKELAENIMAIGFPSLPNVAEGVRINLPCRIITKPSEDGKYLNIEKVLPPTKKGEVNG